MRNENVPKRFEFQIFVLKYDSLKLMHKSKNLPKTGKDFFFKWCFNNDWSNMLLKLY